MSIPELKVLVSFPTNNIAQSQFPLESKEATYNLKNNEQLRILDPKSDIAWQPPVIYIFWFNQ